MYQYKGREYMDEGVSFSGYRQTVIRDTSLVHTHDFIELIYVLNGSATHTIDNLSYEVSRGDLLFVDTGQVHFFSTDTEITFVNLLILPEFFTEQLRQEISAIDLFSAFVYNKMMRDEVPLTRLSASATPT